MNQVLLSLVLLIFSAIAARVSFAETSLAQASHLSVFAKFEYGFISILQHKSQWGEGKTEFNYVKDGGQDLLFPTWRLEAGMNKDRQHRFSFLYQPIFLETEVVLEKELELDNVSFAPNTDLLITYDFPFYRFGYWYLLRETASMNLWFGGGLQIRNANIKFRDRSGTSAFRTSSLGPVPLINLLIDHKLSDQITLHTAFSGFWAPIKYLNGGKTDVNGWFYDLELQPRLNLPEGWECFAGLRVLGGGSIGRSSKERASGGRYNKDIILTSSITAGLTKNI